MFAHSLSLAQISTSRFRAQSCMGTDSTELAELSKTRNRVQIVGSVKMLDSRWPGFSLVRSLELQTPLNGGKISQADTAKCFCVDVFHILRLTQQKNS